MFDLILGAVIGIAVDRFFPGPGDTATAYVKAAWVKLFGPSKFDS